MWKGVEGDTGQEVGVVGGVLGSGVSVCVCVCVCVCERERESACVCVRGSLCHGRGSYVWWVRVCACVSLGVRVRMCACTCTPIHVSVCECKSWLCV